jgi:CcmD family protein
MDHFQSLFVAYMVVWAAFFVYEITVGVRLSRARAELDRLRTFLRLS